MNKSNSRADLEQQNENLMDKTVNLEVEISKLFDEKRKLQDELKHLKKTQNPAVLQENHNPKEIKLDNGKWLDVNFVKEKSNPSLHSYPNSSIPPEGAPRSTEDGTQQ